MNPQPKTPTTKRRTFLAGAGVSVGGAWLAACGGDEGEPGAENASTLPSQRDRSVELLRTEPLTPAMFEALSICQLLPTSTAGPFPSREQLDRLDITEGYPGHPLRLGLRVVDDSCQPVGGSQVEVWHTDATGDYSSFEDGGSGKDEGEGTTFMRGYRTADADGIAELQTMYPGWYGGRAVHIHVRVRVDGDEVLTGQLYLDEDYTESIYQNGVYAKFGSPDTGWADDGLIGDPASDGTGIVLEAGPTGLGEGTVGLVNLGVPLM